MLWGGLRWSKRLGFDLEVYRRGRDNAEPGARCILGVSFPRATRGLEGGAVPHPRTVAVPPVMYLRALLPPWKRVFGLEEHPPLLRGGPGVCVLQAP